MPRTTAIKRINTGSARSTVSRWSDPASGRKGRAVRSAPGSSAPPLKTNWNIGPTSQENAPVAADSTTIAAMAPLKSARCGRTDCTSRR